LAQTLGGDPNDRVKLRIEVRRPVENRNPNSLAYQSLRASVECFLNKIAKEPATTVRPIKCVACEYLLDMLPDPGSERERTFEADIAGSPHN
jgi:hypothetical protein